MPQRSLWPENDEGSTFNTHAFATGFGNSTRAGGPYIIDSNAVDTITFPAGRRISEVDQDRLRARVTTMLIDLRNSGDSYPNVTAELVQAAFSRQPLPVYKRADRLLRLLANVTPEVGELVVISPQDCEAACAWSESLNWQEVLFLLRYLVERGWVQAGTLQNNGFKGWVTVEGYSRIEEVQTDVDSSQAFVAMWFDQSMDEAYSKGIEPAILNTGYSPLKINDKADVDKIDDEIVGEIRRSRFVVADFTHGEKGARGGVYYEAGFAYGLGLHVVRSCHRKIVDENELHFDVRQYYHVVWETADELRDGLEKRIRALIGQGPNRNH